MAEVLIEAAVVVFFFGGVAWVILNVIHALTFVHFKFESKTHPKAEFNFFALSEKIQSTINKKGKK